MRTTKHEVVAVFGRLVKAMGGKVAESYKDVGGYELDYNPTYGGYVINRISNESGAVDCQFGMGRLHAREFVSACHFAIAVLREKECKS